MEKARAAWTVMVYMAGDNNLSDASVRDLKEIASVGATDEVHLVAEHDTAGDGPTYRYYLHQGDEVPAPVMDLGETDSGDPQTLLNFITWARESYPAQHTMLILWGHGRSWQPEAAQKLAAEGAADGALAGADADPALGATMFRGTVEAMLAEAMEAERSICSDSGTGNAIDVKELAQVLALAAEQSGQPIDILGMDACLMCNVELAYELKDCVGYIVGSEEIVPNAGWPYDRLLRQLVDKPAMLPEELARRAPQQYVKRYVAWGYDGPVTLAALDLSRVDHVAQPLGALAEALVAHMPAAAYELFDAQKESSHFWNATLWDIAHFCEALQKRTADEAVRKAAGRVRAAVVPGEDSFIVEGRTSGPAVAQCSGLTIYLRPYRQEISPHYGQLAFATETGWLAMMQAYHAAE